MIYNTAKKGEAGMKQDRRGAVVIMEAAFVFPIMFIIVFVMLMACEAYYQYARVERACIEIAIQGAARCENPMLEVVQETGAVPKSTSAAKVRPYRYILTSEAQAIAAELEDKLEDAVSGFNVMAFRGMSPQAVSVEIDPKMNILVSSFPVKCSFDIKLPIRMIFSNESIKFHYEVQVTEPIGDPTEFVRNVSTVQDYLERSEFGERIENFTGKIKEAMEKLGRFIN